MPDIEARIITISASRIEAGKERRINLPDGLGMYEIRRGRNDVTIFKYPTDEPIVPRRVARLRKGDRFPLGADSQERFWRVQY